MLNRDDIKNLPGYKRILSLGAKDSSGKQMLKTGAFEFERNGDYGSYNITRDGKVKRQSVKAFIIGYCDMQTLQSYDKAFNGIADKMLGIERRNVNKKQNKEEEKQKKVKIALNLISGKYVLPRSKEHKAVTFIFSYHFINDNKHMLREIESVLYFSPIRTKIAENLLSTPGAAELFLFLRRM